MSGGRLSTAQSLVTACSTASSSWWTARLVSRELIDTCHRPRSHQSCTVTQTSPPPSATPLWAALPTCSISRPPQHNYHRWHAHAHIMNQFAPCDYNRSCNIRSFPKFVEVAMALAFWRCAKAMAHFLAHPLVLAVWLASNAIGCIYSVDEPSELVPLINRLQQRVTMVYTVNSACRPLWCFPGLADNAYKYHKQNSAVWLRACAAPSTD